MVPIAMKPNSASPPRPVVLIVLDGWGERAERDDNAVRMAATPAIDAIYARYPHTLIGTSGPDVGLPPGQMGNSEVGHLSLGAGRIALMDISRIDSAVMAGTLGDNAVLAALLHKAQARSGRLHLLGLLSDGGVHSSLEHLLALVQMAQTQGVPVVVHAFLDGRDVQPGTAPKYLAALQAKLGPNDVIGTVSGRFWAMDRDNRWERVERAYRAIVHADAPRVATALEGVRRSYDNQKTDEFVEPFVVGDYAGVDRDRDVGLHFNFRPDRARELTRALATKPFDAFARPEGAPLAVYACMTTYDTSLGLPIAFPKETYPDIFPEIIARAKKTQFRCAETEKYAHVTYFFNGGREEPFEGEERQLIASPKDVATYDLKPEMSADAVADAVVAAIDSSRFDFILVNFANPDMVGHTGRLDAAMIAVSRVDTHVGRIVEATRRQGGVVVVTADHGNCELMKDPETGQPHTAHTLNPVPLLYVSDRDKGRKLRSGGRLADVAPTLLALMGVSQPAAMTGTSLLLP